MAGAPNSSDQGFNCSGIGALSAFWFNMTRHLT
jgi:hypothetical protein